jgi:hypothetical protein
MVIAPTLESHIVRSSDMLATDMDGDLVMLSIERGVYFGISGVGTRIWELLEQPVTIGSLCETICSEYDVDGSVCQADTLAFVSTLLQNGVACLHEPSRPA